MNESSWYLKKSDDDVYGPVPLEELRKWAMDGRVAPEDEISSDQQAWRPAYELSELEMEYTIQFSDGTEYGPVHILALCDVIADGSVEPTEIVSRRGESSPAYVFALPALTTQCALLADQLREASEATGDRETGERLQAELEDVREQYGALEKQVDDLSTEKERDEETIRNLESELDTLRSKETEKSGSEEAWRKEKEALEQAVEAARSDSHALKEKHRKELETESAKVRQAEEEAEKLRKKVQELEPGLKDRSSGENREGDDTAQRIQEQAEEIDRLKAENESLRSQAGEREAPADNLDARLAEEREKYRKKEQNIRHRLEELQSENSRMNRELERLRKSASAETEVSGDRETVPGGLPENPVVRAALSQLKSQILRRRPISKAARPIKKTAAPRRNKPVNRPVPGPRTPPRFTP